MRLCSDDHRWHGHADGAGGRGILAGVSSRHELFLGKGHARWLLRAGVAWVACTLRESRWWCACLRTCKSNVGVTCERDSRGVLLNRHVKKVHPEGWCARTRQRCCVAAVHRAPLRLGCGRERVRV